MAPEPIDLSRYQRQMTLPQVGGEGQRRITEAHVVVVGCGAIGCAAIDTLARAGVGFLTLIDRDVVELGNLHRQCLFDEADAHAGTPKAHAAAARIAEIASRATVHAAADDLTHANAEKLVLGDCLGRPADAATPAVIVDGTDNFSTRYLLNDVSVKNGIPLVYGGVVATGGTAAVLAPGRGPCLRCIAPVPPAPGSVATCESAGVFGPAVQIVGGIQAALALSTIVGNASEPTLVELDAWGMMFRTVSIKGLRDPDCVCCGQRRFEFLDVTADVEPAALCGQNTIQVPPPNAGGVNLEQLAQRLRAVGGVQLTPHMLRLTLPREHGGLVLTIFPTGRALVRGTSRPEVARTVYARFVGA
ncbi:MAG: ThiF family adenylyltransferase [Phycisphaerales bacterium]